jgi:hypothetical protein
VIGSRLGVAGGLLALALGSAALSACGGGSEAAVAAEPFSSAYCVTARNWAVHELDGGGDGAYARGGPPALQKWWAEQLAYLKTSLRQAPPAVRAAEALNERAIRAKLTPLLEKYGFDFERIESEATPRERAFADHPPARYARAQEARDLYQNRVCGYGGSPPPADVTFTRSGASKRYCRAAAAQEQGLEAVAASGFAPKEFRRYATSARFLAALDAQEAAAPAEIAADVKADIAWVRDRKLAVAEEYGYDLRRILREGSADELATWTYWDPAIRRQDSRVEAYVAQVCGMS